MALVDKQNLTRCDGLWSLLTVGQSQLERLRPLLDAQSDERPDVQQVNHGVAPLFLFKEHLPPDVVFDVKAAAGDGDVDMRVLIELPVVGMERTEDTDFEPLLARVAQRNRSLSNGQ